MDLSRPVVRVVLMVPESTSMRFGSSSEVQNERPPRSAMERLRPPAVASM